MKLHLLSDLHLEFYHDPYHVAEALVRPADILVLAGDIHVGFKNVDSAINQFAPHYEHVLFVPGNHEFYRKEINEFTNKRFASTNAHILNPGTFTYEGTTFTGATLWTNFQNDPHAEIAALTSISDFTQIRKFWPSSAVNLFNSDLEFIKNNPADVIITHFLPAKQCIHPKYGNSILNKYFANNLASYISQLDTKLWLFGHTHEQVNQQINNTKLIANPLGYPNENSNYTHLILEL